MKRFFFVFIALFAFSIYLFAEKEFVLDSVNSGAAVAALEKTVELYTEESYEEAMFQAELGIGYAPNMADFPYLKALSARKAGKPSKYCLDYLLPAFNKNMVWHRYGRDDASLLAGSLSLALMKYNDALKFINTLPFEMSDAQLIKAASFYGLDRRVEAEEIILSALDRHSFDSRFPRLFFIKEMDLKKTVYSKNIASRILENLYVWKDDEPFLLPLSVHFENDDKINRRNLKIYREMHTHFLPFYTPKDLFLVAESILSNINYGVLSDEASIREFFSLKAEIRDCVTGKKTVANAIYKVHLLRLVKIVGNVETRELIKNILSNYSGLVLEDQNKDGFLESVLYYKSGRPDFALFDGDQRGYPEFIVECNFGIPKKVYMGEMGEDKYHTLIYDEYPFVSSVQMDDSFFQMRPRTFRWQPFTLERLKLLLFSDTEKHKSFFVLTLNTSIKSITFSTLKQVAAYKEKISEDEKEREFYDRGEIISREKRVDGVVVSLLNYKNGIPSVEKCDIDRDGYFEKVHEYDKKGVLRKISLDFNRDGVFEYNETYEEDGVIKKEWIEGSRPDGVSLDKVVCTVFSSGTTLVEWIHPLNGKLVCLHYEDDEPSTVEIDGVNHPLFKDAGNNIYWFKKIPMMSGTLSRLLEEEFKRKSNPLFSRIVEVSGGAVFAVKSGGVIFAEYVED